MCNLINTHTHTSSACRRCACEATYQAIRSANPSQTDQPVEFASNLPNHSTHTQSGDERKPCIDQTLGDEHPVTEESLQALAAAGGSITPREAREAPPLPSPAIASSVAPVAAIVADAEGVELWEDDDTRPASVSIDPPPPSLECLDRTSSSDMGLDRQVRDSVCYERWYSSRCFVFSFRLFARCRSEETVVKREQVYRKIRELSPLCRLVSAGQ